MTPKPIKRCGWVNADDALMLEYHDREWGTPVHDDRVHFEFLVLEAAQAGLSWSIVLSKREGYRRAFSGFDPVESRALHREACRKAHARPRHHPEPAEDPSCGAKRAGVPRGEDEFGSFDAYGWQFVGGRPKVNRRKAAREIPATSARVRRVQQGSKARFQLRRLHGDLCAHAGGRHGQRSPGRLLRYREVQRG